MIIPDRNDPQFMELITKGIPLERLERRLRPQLKLDYYDPAFEKKEHDGFGNYSQKGFLGLDESLLDVVHADWQIVEKYGTTHPEIARLLEKAIKGQALPNPEYTFKFIASTDGVQRCPWECKSVGSSDIITIYHNDQRLRQAIVTELHPHLIGEHYFFEGRKTIYRADPEIVIPALGLAKLI